MLINYIYVKNVVFDGTIPSKHKGGNMKAIDLLKLHDKITESEKLRTIKYPFENFKIAKKIIEGEWFLETHKYDYCIATSMV